MMPDIQVELHIPPERLQLYYGGRTGTVRAVARDGRRLQFPASALRPFVTRAGVHGLFLFQIDQHGKLLRVTQQGR